MSAIAVITARGGSKRIPGKNKKEFLGKPIICYSIEAALESGLFEEVMVSTDDEEIAEIAKKAGASVPFMRSAKTSDDYATTDDVLIEVLEEYEKMGRDFAYMACIYPTAPFVTAEKLKEAFRGNACGTFLFSAPTGDGGEKRQAGLLLSGKCHETFSGFGADVP